jgi:hypothetical protein
MEFVTEELKKDRVHFAITGGTTKRTKGKVTDRIKTFDDACRELNIDSNEFFQGSVCKALGEDVPAISAHAMLIIIARALNEGWRADFADGDQIKYYPWFKASGVGFSYTDCVYWFTFTSVGSRLCYKSEELARYAGEQFKDLYNHLLQ